MDNIQSKKNLDFLPDGRLADMSQWTPEVARAIAKNEGLTLNQEHLAIIELMRDYYHRYNISPITRLLKKNINRQLGSEFANDDYLESLFPGNVLIQGTRIAGLPVPLLDSQVGTPVENNPVAPRHINKIKHDETNYYFTHDFNFEGQLVKVHPSGNLVDPKVWNEALAVFMAEKESIILIDEHWKLIHYLRTFHLSYGITPMVKLLVDYLKDISHDRMANMDHLYTLFPEGPSRQGSRIAGLPMPQGCID